MKKALIVTHVSGFVPQFELNNVRILQEMGYEVHYASNFHNVSYGTDNHRLEGTGLVCHQVDFVRSPFLLGAHRKAYRQMKELLRSEEFSLLHCHTPVGAALARIAADKYRKNGLKVVYTAHGFHFYKGAPWRYWLLFYPVERFLARKTDVLITINEEDYERAKRFCRKRTRVEHVPGVGVDTDYWSGKNLALGERDRIRRKVREELGVTDTETMLLSVGELIPRKNHSVVIEALAERKNEQNFKYFICGQGVLKDELRKLINDKKLEDRVSLLGYRADIRNLLFATDIFVFPSKQEGLPVALLEAMAVGVEVRASDIRGNRDLLSKIEQAKQEKVSVARVVREFDCERVKKEMHRIYLQAEEKK